MKTRCQPGKMKLLHTRKILGGFTLDPEVHFQGRFQPYLRVHFGTLMFPWRLSTISQVKREPFTHKFISSALQNTISSVLEMSSVNPPIVERFADSPTH